MGNWKKGALHIHTLWSDGHALPEMALHTYRDKLDYDFVCMTDHNIFPGDELLFPVTPAYPQAVWPNGFHYDDLKKSLSILGEKIDSRKIGIRQFVRLKNFDELREEWEIPGKFIILPGCENTACHYSGEDQPYCEFHLNLLNLPRTVTPAEYAATPAETLKSNVQKCVAAIKEAGSEALLMLNHPFWRYWDVDPRWVTENPEINLLEVCNNTAAPETGATEAINTPEKFWDFVLAHRIIRGDGLIYAAATDDSHYYSPEKIHGFCGCDHGWIMVNISGEMNAEKIVTALKNGDFYATTGVEFEKISFDHRSRTLCVEVKNQDNGNCIISFIVTKRNFSQEVKEFEYKGSLPKFNRNIPLINDSIGMCVKKAQGVNASYTMSADDLYVRAEVVINGKRNEMQGLCYPENLKAWTQPFV
ncbi:MAG: hypothetical protein IJC27_08725 [Lentisphaeria bacterium]|nr:hypothetical protein [Lentisphaeria bacterium]